MKINAGLLDYDVMATNTYPYFSVGDIVKISLEGIIIDIFDIENSKSIEELYFLENNDYIYYRFSGIIEQKYYLNNRFLYVINCNEIVFCFCSTENINISSVVSDLTQITFYRNSWHNISKKIDKEVFWKNFYTFKINNIYSFLEDRKNTTKGGDEIGVNSNKIRQVKSMTEGDQAFILSLERVTGFNVTATMYSSYVKESYDDFDFEIENKMLFGDL